MRLLLALFLLCAGAAYGQAGKTFPLPHAYTHLKGGGDYLPISFAFGSGPGMAALGSLTVGLTVTNGGASVSGTPVTIGAGGTLSLTPQADGAQAIGVGSSGFYLKIDDAGRSGALGFSGGNVVVYPNNAKGLEIFGTSGLQIKAGSGLAFDGSGNLITTGAVGGSGTINTLPLFTASSTLGNSAIKQSASATDVTVTGNLNPGVDATYDLAGNNSTTRWRNANFTGSITATTNMVVGTANVLTGVTVKNGIAHTKSGNTEDLSPTFDASLTSSASGLGVKYGAVASTAAQGSNTFGVRNDGGSFTYSAAPAIGLAAAQQSITPVFGVVAGMSSVSLAAASVGVSDTFARVDHVHPLNQAVVPTMTGAWTFSSNITATASPTYFGVLTCSTVTATAPSYFTGGIGSALNVTGNITSTISVSAPSLQISGTDILARANTWAAAATFSSNITATAPAYFSLAGAGALRVANTTGVSNTYPTLGTAAGSLFLSSNNYLYGLYAGSVGADGNSWLQVMRNDAATAYNLILQPAGGNVGIGTTTAASRLTIKGANAKAGAAETVSVLASNDSDATIFELITNFGNNATASSRYIGISAYDQGVGAGKLVLNEYGGNVGIGTTGPGQLLEVNGIAQFDSNVLIRANSQLALYNANNDTNSYITNGSAAGTSDIEFYTHTGAAQPRVLTMRADDQLLDFPTASATTGAATATLGTNGPGGTTPATWLKIRVNGTVRYIPCF